MDILGQTNQPGRQETRTCFVNHVKSKQHCNNAYKELRVIDFVNKEKDSILYKKDL